MRILAAAAITIAMACVASSASAVSLVDLVYTGGSSKQAGTGGTGISANVSDTLSFDVIVRVDAAGLSSIGFDIAWSDPPLTATGASWVTGVAFTSFAPVTSTTLLPVLAGTNQWNNIGFFGLPPFPTSTQVFMGTMTFHVTEDNQTLVSGFFRTDGSSATDGASVFVTPNFASFQVNAVPEPGLAALMGLGLLGLALAGRRKK